MTPCSFVDRQQCAWRSKPQEMCRCVEDDAGSWGGVAMWAHMRRHFTGPQTNANTALCFTADGRTDSTAYWATQYSPQLHTDCWVLGLPVFPTLIYKCLCPLEPTGSYVPPVWHLTILRSVHTVYLCVLCGSQNKQRLFPYTALADWFA